MDSSSHVIGKHRLSRVRKIISGFVAEDARVTRTNSPVHLQLLGEDLGVKNILTRSMPTRQDKHPGIDAMLVPLHDGYSVVIEERAPETRQLYSLAHELAHIMLLESDQDTELVPRGPRYRSGAAEDKEWKAEERFCDEIAAELLMPERVFVAEVEKVGSSLENLPRLANLFRTSLTATAIRYWELLTEPCQLIRWRPTEGRSQHFKPTWQMRNKSRGLSVCPITASSIVKRNEFATVRETWKTLRTSVSRECLLAKYMTDGKRYIRPVSFESEHLGFGGPGNRTILSAVYLGRHREYV